MGVLDFLLLLVVAGVCGFLGGALMGARRMSLLTMVVAGFVGALLGKLIAGYFHLPLLWEINVGGHPFPVVWAVIGSVIVVGLASAIHQH
jgi:uncharacterized membrane protein YeaQ/YmgE (transglycosylase-associated protein family)